MPHGQYSIGHVLYLQHYNFPVYIITYLMFLYIIMYIIIIILRIMHLYSASIQLPAQWRLCE